MVSYRTFFRPKRRVAIRVEQQRLASDADITSRVPMRKAIVPGGYGNLNIPMVDLRMLQNKAIGMKLGGNSYNTIYGLACDQEKRQAWETYALGPEESREDFLKKNMEPGGDSLMSRTRKVMHERLSERTSVQESREKQAKTRRRQLHEDKSFHTLSSSRAYSEPNPETTMNPAIARALALVEMVPAPEAQGRRASGCRRTSVGARAGSKTLPEPIGRRNSFRRSSLGREEPTTSDTLARSGSDSGVLRPFMWGVIRGVLAMTWLLHRVREKHWAADGIRQFLQQVEQVGILKARARHLKNEIIKVQGVCRRFLSRKRQWVKSISETWTSLEDSHLSMYAVRGFDGQSAARRKIMADDLSSPDAKRAAAAPEELKWRVLKIPANTRKFMLGRWYMRQLRKKVQAHKTWQQCMEAGVSQRKDIQQYLKLCGLEDQAHLHVDDAEKEGKLEARKIEKRNYLKITDQEIQELISMSAQELRDVPPFHRHPACIGKSKGARPMSKTAQRRHSLSDIGRNVPEAQAEACGVDPNDLEELFRRFTPRLREIRDAPAAAETGADMAGDALP